MFQTAIKIVEQKIMISVFFSEYTIVINYNNVRYHEFPKHSGKRNSYNFLQPELIKTRQKFNTDRPEIEGGSKRLRLLYHDAWRGVVALEARPLHKESHIAGHLGLYRSNINTGHWYRFATHASILITAIAEEGRELVRSS